MLQKEAKDWLKSSIGSTERRPERYSREEDIMLERGNSAAEALWNRWLIQFAGVEDQRWRA